MYINCKLFNDLVCTIKIIIEYVWRSIVLDDSCMEVDMSSLAAETQNILDIKQINPNWICVQSFIVFLRI